MTAERKVHRRRGRIGGLAATTLLASVGHNTPLRAAEVNGHCDHRVVMALAVAGAALDGETRIGTAEAVAVTFPTFVQCMTGLGASVETTVD